MSRGRGTPKRKRTSSGSHAKGGSSTRERERTRGTGGFSFINLSDPVPSAEPRRTLPIDLYGPRPALKRWALQGVTILLLAVMIILPMGIWVMRAFFFLPLVAIGGLFLLHYLLSNPVLACEGCGWTGTDSDLLWADDACPLCGGESFACTRFRGQEVEAQGRTVTTTTRYVVRRGLKGAKMRAFRKWDSPPPAWLKEVGIPTAGRSMGKAYLWLFAALLLFGGVSVWQHLSALEIQKQEQYRAMREAEEAERKRYARHQEEERRQWAEKQKREQAAEQRAYEAELKRREESKQRFEQEAQLRKDRIKRQRLRSR